MGTPNNDDKNLTPKELFEKYKGLEFKYRENTCILCGYNTDPKVKLLIIGVKTGKIGWLTDIDREDFIDKSVISNSLGFRYIGKTVFIYLFTSKN